MRSSRQGTKQSMATHQQSSDSGDKQHDLLMRQNPVALLAMLDRGQQGDAELLDPAVLLLR